MITPPSSTASGFVRATLEAYKPPARAGGTPTKKGDQDSVELQFNPAQIELSRSSAWRPQPSVTAQGDSSPSFAGAEPRSLSVEVFLDGTTERTRAKVADDAEKLLKLCDVDPTTVDTERPSPPWVRFHWGSFETLSFFAYVSQASVTYTLFTPGGAPLRATCQLSLVEIPQGTKGQNPTSGALGAQRVHAVVAGDSLASLAWQEYGDPTVWRVIAEANDIDDPMRLAAGRELLVPDLASAWTEEVA